MRPERSPGMRLGDAILLLAAVCAGMALAEACLEALDAFEAMERRIAALEAHGTGPGVEEDQHGERVLQVS